MNNQQGIVPLAYRYARALSRWIKAGRPVREEAEIKAVFEKFCKPCEGFDNNSSSCRYCGCRVNLWTAAPLNKIAMLTEECPLGKWGRDNE